MALQGETCCLSGLGRQVTMQGQYECKIFAEISVCLTQFTVLLEQLCLDLRIGHL